MTTREKDRTHWVTPQGNTEAVASELFSNEFIRFFSTATSSGRFVLESPYPRFL